MSLLGNGDATGFGVGELWNWAISHRSPRFCMTTVFRDGPAV